MSERRISVCMATYNGLPYLHEQLTSILAQLDLCDEVIIVDDGSTDGTREFLSQYPDPRLKLIFREKNTGPVRAFEDALCKSHGEYIFLSDQDDVWPDTKVKTYMEIFAANSQVKILCSRVSLIDQQGKPLAEKAPENERPFRTGLISNLLHNYYQGSTMAMRASVLPDMLPFPCGGEHCQLLHDFWIGLRAAQCGHQAMRIEEPQLFYRRHGNNISGRLPLQRQLEKRLRALAALWLHRRNSGSDPRA
jgi:glycosyltransferase involved in cell wall biosynthesis